MKRSVFLGLAAVTLALPLFAARSEPWSKDRAWKWYNDHAWIRGCNFMPSTAANHFDTWQSYGAEERFQVVEKELALARDVGFNTIRVIIGAEWGLFVYYRERENFLKNFERMVSIADKNGIKVIPVLGNDCSRPKAWWKILEVGPQKYDVGYHGGRKASQHGSLKGIGYTALDDPELRPIFFKMCEELLTEYRNDDRILFWNLVNEPGNRGRGEITKKDMRELFELAWKIDPKQPLAADIWSNKIKPTEVEQLAGDLSDVISYHCYSDYGTQKSVIQSLRKRFGRPMINTEWLARILNDEVITSYPVFAEENVGCLCWGFVNGKYQTHEPYESDWKSQFEFRDPNLPVTRWYHDLFRPSLHPYDPEEIRVIRNINAEMDRDRKGESLKAKIAAKYQVTGWDMWYGYRRIYFNFKGHTACVTEPSVEPAQGRPWTWTMQWWEAFVDRSGVLPLLKAGYHHVWIDGFEYRGDDEGLKLFSDFQDFLVSDLGFAKKTRLIGMSWGGFFSTRYAAAYPDKVAKIYLDAPLLNLDALNGRAATPTEDAKRIGPWAFKRPEAGWLSSPEMPVNMAEKIAAQKIPVLLLYGGQDHTVDPKVSCELFARRFKEAGGKIEIENRTAFGHHPHGLDPNKTGRIASFFKAK